MTDTERRAARVEARAALVAILVSQAADPARVHALSAADHADAGTTYLAPGAQITDTAPAEIAAPGVV